MRPALVLALAALGGCSSEGGYGWEQQTGQPPTMASAPSGTSSADDGAPSVPDEPSTPHGGLWQRCHEALSAGSDPVRDVTKLVTACGPVTGMDPTGDGLVEGAVAEGAPVTLELPMQRGRCYRVFASADPSVSELDLEVKTSRGTVVATDHSEGRLAIALPDRPFCTSADDAATIHVRARAGSGAFALEVLSMAAP